jgi:uncharacterized membrane protein
MSEEQKETPEVEPIEAEFSEAPSSDPAPDAASPAAEADVPAADPKEVEEGKVFAILSYVLGFLGIPFFLVPLIMRNNTFSLYHSKQCMMIWLLGMAGLMISGILALVCIGFVTGVALGIFILVLDVMGLINASNGEMKPLPLIGKYADDWFKGIVKV